LHFYFFRLIKKLKITEKIKNGHLCPQKINT